MSSDNQTIEIKITHKFTEKALSDLLVTACEGGISYWCSGPIDYVSGDCYAPLNLVARFTTSEPVPGYADNHVFELTTAKLLAGLQLLSDKYPERMTAIVRGQYDAEDADVFWQLSVFNDVVFG